MIFGLIYSSGDEGFFVFETITIKMYSFSGLQIWIMYCPAASLETNQPFVLKRYSKDNDTKCKKQNNNN